MMSKKHRFSYHWSPTACRGEGITPAQGHQTGTGEIGCIFAASHATPKLCDQVWLRLKESFNCKIRMPGTVKCSPTVAYWVQIDGINIATELQDTTQTRHWFNAVFMLGQRLRCLPSIEPTLNKCTMFEKKSSCPANTRTLYNIYTMSAQVFDIGPTLHNVIQMFCVYWVTIQA